MHIVLFRYSARVVQLDYLAHKDVLVIAPENQRKKYESYLKEGHPLPRILFLEDFVLSEIILEIRKIHQKHKIESITTLSEEDMEMAGFLHDHFVCKNTRSVSNLLFKDKYYMRSFLTGIVKQPYFRLLESKEDLECFWKVARTSKAILKPRNQAGAVGVKKITSNSEIPEEYYAGKYLVEEYISIDKMITCDGYAMGRHIKRFFVHEYEELLLDSLSSSGYYLIRTSTLYEERADLLELAYESCQKVLAIFSVRDEVTPFHFEWFFDFATKEMVLCEVGKRFGGADIPQLILDSYGVDILKEYWEILTDKESAKKVGDAKGFSFPQRISATFSLYRDNGRILAIPAKDQLEWANKVYIFVKPGEDSKKAENIVENSMLVQFTCKNKLELDQRIKELKELSKKFKYDKGL